MDADSDDRRPTRTRRRWLIAASILGLGAVGLWMQRAPIASDILARELGKRGIDSRYRITALGPRAAILENLRLGDPANPDLVARRARVDLGWTLTGPAIKRVTLDGMRLRAELKDGRIRLGALDRLLPEPTGEPFRLPTLDMRFRDARIALATPAGRIGIAFEGGGKFSDGFTADTAMAAPALAASGCTLKGGHARLGVAIVARRIALSGPATIQTLDCGETRLTNVQLETSSELPEALDKAAGRVTATAGPVRSPAGAANGVNLAGRYKAGFAGAMSASFQGSAAWSGLDAPAALRTQVRRAAAGFSATPVAPLATRSAASLDALLGNSSGNADVDFDLSGKSGRIRLQNLAARGPDTTRLRLTGKGLLLPFSNGAAPEVDGELTLSGARVPNLTARLDQVIPGRSGNLAVMMAPFAAGGARLTATPIDIRILPSGYRVSGRALVDGPLGAAGRVEGLVVPLNFIFQNNSLRSGGASRCVTTGFTRVTVGDVTLSDSALSLCPASGTSLVRFSDAGIVSRLNVPSPRLSGRLGETPFALSGQHLNLAIQGGSVGFRLDNAGVRLSGGDTATAASAALVTGRFSNGPASGTIGGFAGKLAEVPLLFDQGKAGWRFANSALTLSQLSARVRDATADPRFEPVRASAATMRLADGVFAGKAALAHIATGAALGSVDLVHRFSGGSGEARIAVPGLRFGEGFQPEQLTRLTRGVIANVEGAINGEGIIGWSPRGVTSTGTFATEDMDLAAAFGPVSGLKGTIRFDDLLGFTTAPHQRATMAELNPGVLVTDGEIVYRILPGFRVEIESGRWPYAGGELILDPTELDFSETATRALTFRVVGLDAAIFVEQLGFKNLAATGLFDGRLPMLFDRSGGRIEKGRLVARRGGGMVAYVGEVSKADIGSAGKMAFDALKRMRYNQLTIEFDGALDGEIVSRILLNGVNEAPVDAGPSGLPLKATGLPFRFNIRIRAPFRGLLNAASSFTDVRATVRRALPTNADAVPGSKPAVQPSESSEER